MYGFRSTLMARPQDEFTRMAIQRRTEEQISITQKASCCEGEVFMVRGRNGRKNLMVSVAL